MNDKDLPPTPDVQSILDEQNLPKTFVRIMANFNFALAVFGSMGAYGSIFMFDSPRMICPLGFLIWVLIISVPISVPICTSRMRKKYAEGDKNKVYLFGFLPLIYMIIIYSLSDLLPKWFL